MPPPDLRPALADREGGPTDAALVARAAGGEAAAFEAIVRRHNRLLFRCVRGIVRDDSEAQDVLQEAYLRAFARLASFRGEAALSTWLTRIALNVALDAERKRGRRIVLDGGGSGVDAAPSIEVDANAERDVACEALAAADAPDAAVERAEVRDLLQSAIDGLPPIYRSVFILRAVEELSVDETAQCLQVSGDVVKTRYLRARALLRDALGARIEAQAQHVYRFAGARCDRLTADVLAELRRQGRIDDAAAAP